MVVILAILIAGCKNNATPISSQTSATTSIPAITSSSSSVSQTPDSTVTPVTDKKSLCERVSRSVSDLKTYYFDRNIAVTKSAKPDKSDQTTTTVISKKAALDLVNRTMWMDNNSAYVKIPSGQMASSLIQTSTYINHNTLYFQGLFPDKPYLWSKTALTEDTWNLQNQARLLVDLINPDNLTGLAAETINDGNSDVLCYSFRISPDYNLLWKLLRSQPGVQLPAGAPEGVTFDQIIKSTDIKFWVDQSRDIPVKATLKVNIQVSPEQVPSFKNTVITNINLSFLFYDFNQPFDVVIPAEATSPDVPDIKDLQKGQ